MIIKKNILPGFLIISILVTSSCISSCYYDKEEVLYPDTVCDTAVITYSQSVAPILSSFCNSCHGGNTPSAGIKLDTYTDTKIQVTNGRLWGAVSHSTNYSPMPKNATMLNTCNLAKIKKWLDAGALNN
ncbi:MAG TPA: hypothetical protein VK498_03395 [Ferruginibacter sp.]|nr:hypothetical protein [Ferruginibacter sp.]